MKKTKLLLLLPLFFLGACVPSKKYNDLQAKYVSAVEVNKKCNTQLDDTRTQFDVVKKELDRLSERLTALRADSIETHGLYLKYMSMHKDLNASYEKLLSNSSIDKDRLSSELKLLEQQRVSIARALLNNPQIILADEPTGNLDPAVTDDIMNLLHRISQNNTSVIMATHDYRLLDEEKGKVYKCEGGKINLA